MSKPLFASDWTLLVDPFQLLFIKLTKHEGASLGVDHPLGSWSANNPLQLYDNHACYKASS